jgi:hypothetical protein
MRTAVCVLFVAEDPFAAPLSCDIAMPSLSFVVPEIAPLSAPKHAISSSLITKLTGQSYLSEEGFLGQGDSFKMGRGGGSPLEYGSAKCVRFRVENMRLLENENGRGCDIGLAAPIAQEIGVDCWPYTPAPDPPAGAEAACADLGRSGQGTRTNPEMAANSQ